jgi:hypothetical protein
VTDDTIAGVISDLPLDFNATLEQQPNEHHHEQTRYVRWRDLKPVIQGRESEIVDALGIIWRTRATHVCCPLDAHPDNNPSFRWDENDSRYYCSCGSGSALDLITKVEKIDFEHAKIRAAEFLERRDLIKDPSSPAGLTLQEYASAKRLPIGELLRIGVRQSSYGQIKAAIRTPYFRLSGESSVRFRVNLNGDKKKRHYWRKGDKACLYGEWFLGSPGFLAANYAIIVEGESDCQTCWFNGGFPALGLPGAGQWNEERDAHRLADAHTVFVVIEHNDHNEPDEGGKVLLSRIARSSIASRVRLVRLPDGIKDASALHLRDPVGFPDAFRALLDAAQLIPKEMIKQSRPPRTANTNLPIIEVRAGGLHEAADEGLAALRTMDVEFYQRDRSLVRVARIKAKASDGTTTTTPGIIPVTLPMLRRALGQSARWQILDEDGDPIPIDPPKDVNEQIASMVGEWPFDPLAGVIGAPTLRPDGSLLLQEGYDAITGLALLSPPATPPIPNEPTRADAERALALLDSLLTEFPFVGGKDGQSKSVALSMLLTPVLRGGLPPAVPIHLVTKPAAGSGGSYLADIASAIATGERCAVIAMSPKPEETEKRLIGAAISGYPIIPLDNCSAPLDGDFLCQVSERPLMQLRPLGTSDKIRVVNTFTILANGNQASVTNDVVRRTIVCGIDANMERPEDREFKQNPLAMVMSDRGKYIAACLIVARAYIVAGRPNKPKPLLSFERWSDTVRGALIWLGRDDPVATMAAARAQDEPLQQRAAVFKAWAAEYVMSVSVLTSDIIKAADETHSPSLDKGASSGWKRSALREALLAVAEQKGPSNSKAICSRRLGKWLTKNANNIVGVCKLTADRSDTTRPRWRLEPTKVAP